MPVNGTSYRLVWVRIAVPKLLARPGRGEHEGLREGLGKFKVLSQSRLIRNSNELGARLGSGKDALDP